jgi:hypothetical protein
MPVPRLCWGIRIRLDDEATLPGHTPERLGYHAKGATVPTVGSCYKVRKDTVSSLVAEYPIGGFMRW